MVKAKLVFESPDTFLSFPALSPLTYAPEQLKFLPAFHDLSVFAEFSRLTNALPGGAIFQPSLDETLDSVYLNILRTAQVAQGTLTDQQTAELQQAQAYLQTEGPGGLPAPSAAVLAYNQYQQAYIRATQNYKTQQLTAQASDDANVRSHWQDVDEPLLRAAVDAAENDWETKGFKAPVEAARQVVQIETAQSPMLQLRAWVSQCNPDLDFMTDVSNQLFAPTIFAPYDILDQANWPTFTIASSEIQQLAAQAPAELTNAVGTVSPQTTTTPLSFQFCSAGLVRPWFHSEVFSSRFWKFADPTSQLSDGGTPPKGLWPAYVTAVVFARNISGGFHYQFHPLFHPPLAAVQPAGTMTAAAQPAATMTAVAPGTPAAPPSPVIEHPMVLAKLNAAAYTYQVRPAAAASLVAQSSGSSAPPPPSALTAGPVSILAFVCKRLPKCPDPDQNLHW